MVTRADDDPAWRLALGRRIRVAYGAAGLNRHQFAKGLGTTYPNVLRWESGDTAPTAPYLAKIAALCCVTTDWLLGQPVPPSGDARYTNRETAIRRGVAERAGRWDQSTLDAVRSQLLLADQDPSIAEWQERLDAIQTMLRKNSGEPDPRDVVGEEETRPPRAKGRPSSVVRPVGGKGTRKAR
jgi:transcriptional regulator with XRE-family HTH domain